jgi:Family of unknown function (DUF6599)
MILLSGSKAGDGKESEMADKKIVSAALAAVIVLAAGVPAAAQDSGGAGPKALLPQVQGWKLSEAPRTYLPAALFEYIDGAAENYLSYGFQELAVADFKSDKGQAALTVEIYDMGSSLNAFGIYSAERYPGSRYLEIGAQGYYEEGTLNFFAGNDYVKLICFDCGETAEVVLKEFAGDIEKRVGEKAGGLPPVLGHFPRAGLVANSEKFIRQNVLGYAFLHDGYLASYRVSGQEFELFIIAGRDAPEALKMLEQYLAVQAKNGAPVEKAGPGYHVQDRYAQNVFLAAKGRYLLGAMRLKNGGESVGMKYLGDLLSGVED